MTYAEWRNAYEETLTRFLNLAYPNPKYIHCGQEGEVLCDKLIELEENHPDHYEAYHAI